MPGMDANVKAYLSKIGRQAAKARMKKLTAEERSRIARNAAKSRWAR